MSGGIDSSVVAALAVRVFGPERFFGIMMPEKDSADDSRALAELLAETLGIETVVALPTTTGAAGGFPGPFAVVAPCLQPASAARPTAIHSLE